MAKYTPIKYTSETVGDSVEICGWVHTVRDMGKMAFIDLRDHTALVQVVISSDELPRLSPEDVVAVSGLVKERGERFVNPNLTTGAVEVKANRIEILSESDELPIEIKKDTRDINEEVRLKYRYLDLRSDRMQANIRLRHNVSQFVRNHLSSNEFIEVETPLLTKGTPEGAREFLVPSRLHPGQFYVLPQSPQQFKQLLMVGGIGRYFQLAKALRDEDQRGDRQPEHTQIDMEMSFVEQEDVLQLVENMMVELVDTLMPEHHITQAPFPRMTYAEAMDQYGTDKPDLRKDKDNPFELAFCWVVDFPMFEKETSTGETVAMHHPFTAPKSEHVDKITDSPLDVLADAYDLALNGYEVGGGSVRISNQELQYQVFEALGIDEEEAAKRFGHMLEAFRYGVPPHAGIALGLDRLLMVLAGEPNIREVMAFPKTGDARDPLTGAPSETRFQALKDAHIKLDNTEA